MASYNSVMASIKRKQKQAARWLWFEYQQADDVAYLEAAIHQDNSFLCPLSAEGSLLQLAIDYSDFQQ